MKTAPVIVVQIVHIDGPRKGQIQEFTEPEISFGRYQTCSVQFPKDITIISRKHASIIREGNRFKLINHSPNGTLLNGKSVEESYLKDGDVLTIAEGGPRLSFLTEMRADEEIPAPVASAPRQSIPPEIAPEPKRIPEPVKVVKPPVPTDQPHYREMETQPKQPVSIPKPEPVLPKVPRDPLAPSPSPMAGPIQRVQVSLSIQYGPTLRSFKELPITVGRSPQCDYLLEHPEILDQHAQIFFTGGQYFIKDLTGRQAVSINGRAVAPQGPLNPNDTVALSPSGPRFRFLAGGRLAEIEGTTPEERPQGDSRSNRSSSEAKPEKEGGAAKSILNRFLRR